MTGTKKLVGAPSHACGGRIETRSAHSVCTKCKATLYTDELGVVCPTGPPGSDASASRDYEDFLHVSSLAPILDPMYRGNGAWPIHRQLQLLDSSSGIAAVLTHLRVGDVALDLGTGWSRLGDAVSSLGGTPVCADWDYGRLRFTTMLLDPRPAQAVLVDLSDPLPWENGSFDAIFVDLSQIDSSRADAGLVLQEVTRLLAHDGVAVIAAGGSLDHRDLRESLLRVRRIWRPAWQRPEIGRAGLTPRRVFVPVPRRRGWQQLVPLERLASWLRTRTAANRRQRWAARVSRLGGSRWLVRDCFLIAQHADALPVRPVVEQVIGADVVVSALQEERVAIFGSTEFAKLPLSVEQQHEVRLEVAGTNEARDTKFGPYVVDCARLESRGALSFGVFSRIKAGPLRLDTSESRDALERTLTEILRGLDWTPSPIETTDLWREVTEPHDPHEPRELTTLKATLRSACQGVVVPAGPTHGDLHPWNVLVPSSGGPPIIIDWGRFASKNPLLVDSVGAAVALHALRAGIDRGQALSAFVEGEISGELATLAVEHLGDLTVELAAALTLLTPWGDWRRAYSPRLVGHYLDAIMAMQSRLGPAQG